MSVDIVELDLSSPNVIRMKWYRISISFVLKCCTGLREILMALSLSHQRGTLSQVTRNPLKFASSIGVVHNNYRRQHTPPQWTRETHHFAFWKTNLPKSNQGIGTLWKWTSYPLCLPPNRNSNTLQAWSLLLLGTISQSLGYEPNIERFAWPPHSGFP